MDYLQLWDDGTITIANWDGEHVPIFKYSSDPEFDPGYHLSRFSIPIEDLLALLTKVCDSPPIPPLDAEIERLWNANKGRVYVIKYIREREGIGLKEAVDVIKEWEQRYCEKHGFRKVEWGNLSY